MPSGRRSRRQPAIRHGRKTPGSRGIGGRHWIGVVSAPLRGARRADVDLELSDDQELMRDTTARFIESACPLTKVRELADSHRDIGPDYRREAGELGWFAMLVP